MKPVVHVLLATYNGERHLAQQWHSIEQQQGVDVVMHLADDGSTDGTVPLLRELAARRTGAVVDVRWMDAPPRRSATKSFMQLLASAVRERPNALWFSFCDQDDIWLPDKLSSAVAALGEAGDDARPALYGARTLSVDEEDRPLWLSPLFVRPPCFRNAIVQSILGGNTMLMNRAAAQLVAGSLEADITSHDWFTYQLVSAAGGDVHYDPRAFVRYRQHAANEVGTNRGWGAAWRRFKRVLRQDYKSWNTRHVAALVARNDRLTPDSREVLGAFLHAREGGGPVRRLQWLRRSGVFRQSAPQQAILLIACALRRI
jgi:glycosyltransferase involved in cell wall biosynthesis